jgi:OOP family OmpA-OmpF porin
MRDGARSHDASRRVRTVVGCVAVAFAGIASPGLANAQTTGFAVNRFEPSERGSDWFALESLDLRGNGRPAFGVVADYQLRPLAIYDADGTVRSSPLEHVMTTHVGASFVFGDRLRVGASLPVVIYETGDTGRLGSVVYPPPSSDQAIGDLRFGVDLRLFGEHDGPFTMALGAQVWLPTGDTANYTSDGRVRAAPHLLAAGEIGAFVYAAKLGVTFRNPEADSFANSPVGHELSYGASAGARVAKGRLLIGPEAFGTTVLTDQTFKTRTTPIELLLGGHYAFVGGTRIGLGGGPGLTRGYGSPALRLLGSLEWSPEIIVDTDGDGIPDDHDACRTTRGVRSADPDKNGCPPAAPPADRDGDGVLDKDDACPDVPGKVTLDPRTNGCADRDLDGIADPLDACVDVPGVASADPKQNGCPELDTDKDGVLDKEDACPTVAGLRTDDPKTNGCPDPDRDKDGVLNDVDACPDEPGKPDPDPKRNGCPKAFVQGTQIKILDQVKFKTGSAEIVGKDSDEILQAVQKVLVAHPEITSMRVEGHTDNRGAAALNRKLSKDRAASVVTWLVKHGIDKSRLTSEGFGPDRPIADNGTDTGRQDNRRVEFHIDAPAAPAPGPGAPPHP